MEQQTNTHEMPKIAWGVIGVVVMLALLALVAVMFGVDVGSIIRS